MSVDGLDDIVPGLRRRGRRIGLLGGSFNPAHEAHREISLTALARLGLDEVWWLVSPQNPLKPVAGMAPLPQRLSEARRVARHPRIRVTGIEARLGTTYTADTIDALKRRFPALSFVWLMGADNLIQIDRWQGWQRIFHAVPVAVFARPSYCFRALTAKAAQRFARNRLPEHQGRLLARRRPPSWVFVHGRLNPISASAIRARRGAEETGTARSGAEAPGAVAADVKGRATAEGLQP
ncbi:MAG: putative nicotinate-nucleotide adenylyltransferase [Alphaproteobacteria bacterium]|nr:MAG: putative nicotinate-nucleotide adenylyltransferase [Alphaproteobacteria bacterium]